MDIPLATNNIGIRNGFKGYTRKSSTFCPTAGVGGLSAFMETFLKKNQNFGYGMRAKFINRQNNLVIT